MNNPEFMQEMKRMMETPEMKAALAKVFQAGVHAQPIPIPESVLSKRSVAGNDQALEPAAIRWHTTER